MSWFKRKKEEKYQIVGYPETSRYVAKRGKRYLKESYPRGIIIEEYDIVYADWCRSKEDAEKLIRKHKEQNGRVTVNVWDVD
jgi:hypothetical protein